MRFSAPDKPSLPSLNIVQRKFALIMRHTVGNIFPDDHKNPYPLCGIEIEIRGCSMGTFLLACVLIYAPGERFGIVKKLSFPIIQRR